MDRQRCNICNKSYATKKTLENHIQKLHPGSNNSAFVSKEEENQGWDKDQIELALEMSMKEQFKDFIPNEDELIELSSHKTCIICAVARADVAFIECGHMVTCDKCADIIKNESRNKRKCPVCRKEVKKVLKIYS